ncbi:MAG: hypothetical protein PVF83_06465 [Anaerolineales bacterium]|jgi:hypothetical protein
MKVLKVLVLFISLSFLFLSGCTSTNTAASLLATDDIGSTAADLPLSPTDSPDDPDPGWQTYDNTAVGLGFQFPSSWFGPDEYLVEDDIRLEIGSDVVYSYGTDRTEQIYTLPDSYYILIQYRPNTDNLTMDDYQNSSWISPPLGMFDLEDGDTRTTARSLEIKVRDLELGRFKGVEYIATLSETAQTERVYSRQIFLLDEQLNILMISASPNNVEVADPANWKADFQRVDEANLETFYHVIESIVIE